MVNIRRYLGPCPTCRQGMAVDRDTAHEAYTRTITATCTGCGAQAVLHALKGIYNGSEPCDGACMSAIGPNCSCSCGGDNHGAGFISPVGFRAQWVTEADARRIAAAKAREATKRQAEQDRLRAAREALIAQHPALAHLRDYANDSEFMEDMWDAFAAGRMSPRQAEAAAKAVARSLDRARRRTESDARAQQAREAGVSAPTGRITVRGTVAACVVQETHHTYAGESTLRMLLEHQDGWSAWMTCPVALQEQVTGKPGETVYGQYAIVRRDLVGKEVEVTVTLKAGRDALVVNGTRPTKPTLLVPAAA